MKRNGIPRIDDILVPVMVGLFNISGSGSIFVKAYLEDHHQVHMKSAYPSFNITPIGINGNTGKSVIGIG